MEELDSNHDGVLSEQEFILLLSQQSSNRYMQLLRENSVGFSSDVEHMSLLVK